MKTRLIDEGGKMLVAVADVKVTRNRFRPAEKIPQLSESLKTYEQLQPIIIEQDGELVDGFRRLNAAKAIGWTEIWAVFKYQINELMARTLELETNVQREDMTWQERTRALAELHRLKQKLDPTFSQDLTAQIAGVPQSRVSEALTLQKMMELFPEIGEAKSVNQALNWAKTKAASVMRVQEVKNAGPELKSIEERIVLGNSIDVIKVVPDDSFNLVLTDPPFGIDYDSRTAGTEGTLSSYTDDKDSYLALLSMAPDLYRVVKPNGWLVWFLGITWYERAKIAFRDAGFTVDEIPIIWDRSEGRTFTSRPDRWFGRGYDIALHCIKGEPQLVQRGKSNIIKVAPVGADEKTLLVERPVELYQELIRRMTIEGEIVADFFTGSGSVLAAAASLKRKFFGVELDPERRAVAIKKVAGWVSA